MLWIKRNLFLVIFGVIALGLLGWSVMYFLGNRATNAKLEEDLQAAKTQLEGLYNRNPFPSKTNIDFAKSEVIRVRTNINAVKQYFAPVTFDKVADKDFTAVLQNTIFDLQKRAQQLGIELPERDYAFSFKAQKSALTFAPAPTSTALSNTNDDYLLTTNWRLKAGGQVVMNEPRHIVLRDTINHWSHHRGQLTVYLRLLGQPVPSVYGPTADDKRFL